jgi:hypothetical protein
MSPGDAALRVGLPAVVSPYQKVVEEEPAGMVTDVTAAPWSVGAKVTWQILGEEGQLDPCGELELRLTVSGEAATVGLPYASSSLTVIEPMLAVLLAVPLGLVDVRTSLAGGAVVMENALAGVIDAACTLLELESVALSV